MFDVIAGGMGGLPNDGLVGCLSCGAGADAGIRELLRAPFCCSVLRLHALCILVHPSDHLVLHSCLFCPFGRHSTRSILCPFRRHPAPNSPGPSLPIFATVPGSVCKSSLMPLIPLSPSSSLWDLGLAKLNPCGFDSRAHQTNLLTNHATLSSRRTRFSKRHRRDVQVPIIVWVFGVSTVSIARCNQMV